MRHQNYTNYLQKEIDFLKTLVTRFHDQEHVASIELDIALLKTQHIYEQLLQMKLMKEVSTPDDAQLELNEITSTITGTQKISEPIEPKNHESVPFQVTPKPEEEPIHVTPVLQKDPEKQTVQKPPVIVPELTTEPEEQEPEKISSAKKPDTKGSGILAEKIRPSGYNPINETLAQKYQSGDLSSKLQSSPLQSISSGIGLNDRFLFTRELFQGNADLYNQTVQKLDQAHSFEDAMNFINRHFNWNKDEITTQKFVELIQRRHR